MSIISTGPDPIAAAQSTCATAGNDVITCFPTAGTLAVQDEVAAVVWNSNLPNFTQTERIDIYLFHADTQELVFNISDVVNPKGQAGTYETLVNDSWWGDRGSNWAGANLNYSFFWILSGADEPLDGAQVTQATFTAVQTTFVPPTASSPTNTAPLQSTSHAANGSGTFTATDIAGVTVGSFFAILIAVAILFLMRRRRRRVARNTQVPAVAYTYRSKAELNAEMRAAHGRLQSLRLLNRRNTARDAAEQGEVVGDLQRQIETLMAEVERLRALGAEEPPPYSLQPDM
ncbi:hypothetical protein K438DRAFT_1977243 [Mycena galopus ATCC 62051]|nr:hypothetical protein K438DRAFT_1977243 [Mycena galopus ATCC 62051]